MKITLKTNLVVLGFQLLTSLSVGLIVFIGLASIGSDYRKQDLKSRSETVGRLLRIEVEELTKDVELFGRLVEQALSVSNIDNQVETERLRGLQAAFMQAVLSNDFYTQLRYISAVQGGREVLRVNRFGDRVILVDNDHLQDKGHRDYYQESISLKPGEIYFSRVDLNKENGEIQKPYEPTFRVATAVYSPVRELLGVVVANIDFDLFIGRVFESEIETSKLIFTDAEGYYLLGPPIEERFGFELPHGTKLDKDFPEASGLLRGLEAETSDSIVEGVSKDGTLFHFYRIHLGDSFPQFIVGMTLQQTELIAAKKNVIIIVCFVVLAILLCAGWLTRFLTRQVTGPISLVADAAHDFANGIEAREIPISRHDEIGTLAKNFQEMRLSVQREKQRVENINARLSDANKDLENFAHLASHEMREPLIRLSGLAQLAMHEMEISPDEFPPELVEIISCIEDESRRSCDQITQFRRFSRLSSEEMERTDTDIQSLVQKVLQEVADELTSRRAKVEVGKLPQLPVYPEMLGVVYRNLLENAMKYAQGDSIELRFTFAEENGKDVFGVWNSGSEIKPEHRDHIFKPFRRYSYDQDGTGLGLALCSNIVTRHSGKIWVESESNWTHFRFTLS